MNFSFLSKKKISKNDSTVILKSLRALMSLGNSLYESVVLQSEIEEGDNNKILKKIIHYTDNKNEQIEKLFLGFGLIDKSEHLILFNSKDTKEAISDIIRIRGVSNNFIKTVITLFIPVFVGLMIGLSIIHFILPIFMKPINQMIDIIKLKNGVDVNSLMNIPSFLFYIKHPESVVYIFFGSIGFIVLVIFLYNFLIKFKPYIIYKFLTLKAYDDIPYIFLLMRSLNKGGMDIYAITKILEKSNLSFGWRKFFFFLRKQIEQNKPIYLVFKRYNFPKQIYVVLKTSETSKSFWESFDGLIKYSEEVNIIKNKQILDRYKIVATMISYSIIIFFLLGILMLMMSMQSLAMAMQ